MRHCDNRRMTTSATPTLHWRQQAALHWRMTRPAFLLLTLSACVLGIASGATQAGALNATAALATVLLGCMAHAGANVLNDYHDSRNGADTANTGGLYPFSGGSRLIQQGAVSEAQTGRWGAVLLLVLLPAGLLIAWAYSAPPLQLMSRGVGEFAVAGAWWGVVIGADYVQRHGFSATPAALGLGLALLVACLLLINGFPDARGDAQVGKRTLVVRLGTRRAAALYAVLVVLAHGWLALAATRGLVPAAALWGLLSLPLSLAAAAALWRHAATPPQLRPAIGLTIAAANLHALAIAVALFAASR